MCDDAEACEACLRFYLPRLAANEEGLRQLSMPSRGVDDVSARRLCDALRANTEVEELNLARNLLSDDAMESVADLIKNSCTLTRVNVSDNKRITGAGVQLLVEALRTNSSVAEIYVDGCGASDEALAELAASADLNRQPLPVKSALHSLRAGTASHVLLGEPSSDKKRQYTLESVKLITDELRRDKRVTVVDFSNNASGDVGTQLMSDVLRLHPSLRELHLDGCGITDKGALALTEALKENTVLTELRLADNEIGDAGADMFVKLVRENATLAHVVLERNNITPSKRHEVVHALLLNSQPPRLKAMHPQLVANDSTLRVIDLRDQQRDGVGVQVNDITCRVLSNCLRTNNTVHTINLSGNRVGDDGAKLLCALLKSNSAVKKLQLKDNCVTRAGLNLFIDLLRNNNVLEEVGLAEQRPEPIPASALRELEMHLALNREPAAFKALAPLLMDNDPSVHIVDLSLFDGARRPTSTTCKLLCDAMKDNSVVSELQLSGNPQVGAEGVACVLNLLTDAKGRCGVKMLGLARMELSDSDITPIADLLCSNAVLTDLDVSGNSFTDLREWVDVLRSKNHTLRSLSVDNEQGVIDEGDMQELQVMLALNRQPRTLKDLVLRVYENDPTISEIELVEYESAIVTGDNSYSYRRRYNDDSVELLSGALSYNRHVTKLNLSCNCIGDRGALALAEMLRLNRSITTLSLANNQVTDAGFMQIADALLTNPTLQCVVTDQNPVKDPMTRKHLNMATSHNAQVAATVYSTVDTTQMTADVEKELDDAVMADAIADMKRPGRTFKDTMATLGESLFTPPCF